jgi:hypothetical protein
MRADIPEEDDSRRACRLQDDNSSPTRDTTAAYSGMRQRATNGLRAEATVEPSELKTIENAVPP